MKRCLLRLIAAFSAVGLLVIAGVQLLRDVPAGTYSLVAEDSAEVQGWAQVDRLMPVMRIYGPQGSAGPGYVLLPLLRIGIPLQWRAPVLRYEAQDAEQIRFRRDAPRSAAVAMLPMREPQASQHRQAWQAQRDERAGELAAIAQSDVAPAWQTDVYDGAFSLRIPDGYVMRSVPSLSRHPVIRLVQRGQAVDGESYLQFEAADEGRAASQATRAAQQRGTDAIKAGDSANLSRTAKGEYLVFADYRFGDLAIVARGITPDQGTAGDFVGVLNAIEAGAAPLALLSGEYIPAIGAADSLESHAWWDAVADRLAPSLEPTSLLSRANFAQPRSMLLPDDQATATSRGISASVVVGLLADANAFPETDMSIKAQNDVVRVSIDEGSGTCVVEFALALGPYAQQRDLALVIAARSSSLPDCQYAAQQFAALDIDDIQRQPAIAQAKVFAPHAGKFSDARPGPEGSLIVSDGMRSGVIRADGNVEFMLDAQAVWPLAGQWRYQRDGRQGIVDTEGNTLLAAEYDDIALLGSQAGAMGDTLVQLQQGDKQGIFDVSAASMVLAPIYDAVTPMPGWNMMRAQNGDSFRLIGLDAEAVRPETFTAYIIGEPGSVRANDRDFIALKTAQGAWIFHTRTPQPLVQGTFRDVRMDAGGGARVFHLTRPDGARLRIDSFLNPIP